MSLHWNGDAVTKELTHATRLGIDETMSKCVVDAKSNYYQGHGLITSVLQGSIKMEPSALRDGHVVGTWGSFTVDYALYVEQGTGRTPGQGQLQGAADREYPRLAARIRAHREAG